MTTPPPHQQPFGTVLVANRGEIALRILRAVKNAGLRSVAVYSDVDRDAPHVRAADAAVRIGAAPASESYLSIPRLLEAAQAERADAVHPGYGFLSERPEFARAVVAAGLVFIGPPADVMDAMGRKDRARAIAVAAGVPVVPAADLSATEGSDSDVAGTTSHSDLSDAQLEEIVQQVGFPLLVKAAAGGGGKGMRIVRQPQSLPDAVAAARREAMAAFGDDTMIFERYVESGRHIEVQILADSHGNVVHLHERDCSVQRRHQKVLEEAPAVAITDSVRELVLASALALAKEVGYVNAGTVEFLVADEEVFFLEMNTRLQVEHPVTELVTGLDLVALQLAVAQGDRLPFSQSDITVRGHAIEARVYAEDPRHGFLPQAGTAAHVEWPEGVRVDAALRSGQRVGTHYDPMLGKLIAWGADREVARRNLVAALDGTAILGLTTNVGFLRALCDSAAFRDSEIDTAWLDNQPPAAFDLAVPDEAWCLAAWATAKALAGKDDGPFGVGDGWRLAAPPAPVSLSLRRVSSDVDGGGNSSTVDLVSVDLRTGVVTRAGAAFAVREFAAAPEDWATAPADRVGRLTSRAGGIFQGAEVVELDIDGVLRKGVVLGNSYGQLTVAYQGATHVFEQGDDRVRHAVAGGDGSVAAPMPGTVLAVNVEVGEHVLAGQPLAVIEAMKMELVVKAPLAGVLTAVHAETGAQVELGEILVQVSPPESAGGGL
ncbi:MAG: biotin/lipoyl-binding protein [Nocardioidaceae bacterium]|nr:biotin/lipoyl-binding protein [Nocardioidaceae bacterium]